jgi:hypothetical protein
MWRAHVEAIVSEHTDVTLIHDVVADGAGDATGSPEHSVTEAQLDPGQDGGDVAGRIPSADGAPSVQTDLDPLARYGLVVRDGALLTTRLQPVANFTVRAIRSGTVLGLDGNARDVHLVEVDLPDGSYARWELAGDLYAVDTWRGAGGGRAKILKPGLFAAYLFQRIERDGVAEDDPVLDTARLAGTYLAADGRLRVGSGIDEDSAPLSLHATFQPHEDGDNDVFEQVVRLSDDDTVRAVLVHGLGVAFKPVLRAYPHLGLQGDRGSGKTTILGEINERFGFIVTDAVAQLGTVFRRKVTLNGASLPAYADEIGRLGKADAGHLADDLNIAYTGGISSHGAHGHRFALTASFVGVGQDWHVNDEALLTKMLLYELDRDARNPDALATLRANRARFPMGPWLEFACEYASEHDLGELAESKAALLAQGLPDDLSGETAEFDRCIWNYATQLVVADALLAYGVEADINDFVAERLVAHLRMLRTDSRTIPERFLDDLMTLLARRTTPNALLVDVTDEGIHLHVDSALRALKSAGYDYDVSDPRRMTVLLGRAGIARTGQEYRHRFKGVRKQAVLIPHAVLEERGHHIDIGT